MNYLFTEVNVCTVGFSVSQQHKAVSTDPKHSNTLDVETKGTAGNEH